jgi:hypothetical protein
MAWATTFGASTRRRYELSIVTRKRDAGVTGGQVTETADRGCGVAVPVGGKFASNSAGGRQASAECKRRRLNLL